jgi:hypothetical protein
MEIGDESISVGNSSAVSVEDVESTESGIIEEERERNPRCGRVRGVREKLQALGS